MDNRPHDRLVLTDADEVWTLADLELGVRAAHELEYEFVFPQTAIRTRAYEAFLMRS